ncbi:hypothetical protein DSCOOX_12240 [Desulfosarcina ovata subsp. ovata]|jgi:hypothetical protein|uniref:Uncharacterized protein n=2 Tax=Desulfosarcina ovata TaxID=83564 RepID=A0A5K8A6P6_9BACT|nr:hypothetical protein DSCOOX_12240 [Desulfosarcina ovata subsp. ovata]
MGKLSPFGKNRKETIMAVVIKDKQGNGKHYETVAERVRKFRDKFPVDSGWQIVPEISFPKEDTVLCNAAIINPEGVVVAKGTAEEVRSAGFVNRTSAVENCETSAIGRALFSAGFGGGEFCSADELYAALTNGREIEKAENKASAKTNGKAAPRNRKPSPGNRKSSDPSKIDDFGYLEEIGIGIKIDDGHLVVAEGEKGVIYRHRGVLKASGFRFNGETKQWTRPLH